MSLATSVPRESFGALFKHLGWEFGIEPRASLLADTAAFLGTIAIDRALDIGQPIDTAHNIKRNLRDHQRRLAVNLGTLKSRHLMK